jgi:hypothetical protein
MKTTARRKITVSWIKNETEMNLFQCKEVIGTHTQILQMLPEVAK